MSAPVTVRRVRGPRGIVVVSYRTDKRQGSFMAPEGLVTMVGGLGYVMRMARGFGVPVPKDSK